MTEYSAAAIWSFATPGVAMNAARDLGGRLWAISIWGLQGTRIYC